MTERNIEAGFFCKQDFADAVALTGRADLVEYFNNLLRDWLKEQPEALGNKHQNLDVSFWQSGKDISGIQNQTHKARLVGIKEIKKHD